MKLQGYKCDVCGIAKQEANHWWKGYVAPSGGIMIFPWDQSYSLLEAHLCGEQHAITWASQNLANSLTWDVKPKETAP